MLMSDTPRTEAFAAELEAKIAQGHDGGLADYYDYACQLERALQSIAANTCCDKCREAAVVARQALS